MTEYQDAKAAAIRIWQSIKCPVCHAQPGIPCKLLSTSLKGTDMLEPHLARRDAAEDKLKENL